MARKYSKLTRPAAVENLKRLREQLAIQDMTAQQMADFLVRVRRMGQEYAAKLHNDGETYICGWVKKAQGGDWAPKYRLGVGRDKPKPKRMTSSQVSKRYRERMAKNDPAKYMDWVQKNKLAARKRRAATRKSMARGVKPDPLLAWVIRVNQPTGEKKC